MVAQCIREAVMISTKELDKRTGRISQAKKSGFR